jgi:pimeloyl-ACP methyl ester carboxylesterase
LANWKKHYLNMTEVFRSVAARKNLRAVRDDVLAQAPDGDGHPVLVIPGFTASDGLTRDLRDVIAEKGYKTYGWEDGYNLGLDEKTADRLGKHLEKIFKDNGGQKITLVGHSLGGIYARELAREYPEMVREVITIGSPFGAGVERGAVPGALRAVFEWMDVSGPVLRDTEETAQRLLTPPPVPTTSIFSKEDGIAGWEACLNPALPEAENIEVKASHIGLIWDPEAFGVVLDRLAQPEGQWKPFSGVSAEKAPQNPAWKPSGKNLFRKD